MSNFDKSRLYLILNENSSPVFVPTRNGGFMMDGGSEENPAIAQLYFGDIVEINSTSDLFRNGHIFFEKEYEADIYEELRIANWKDILHNSDIENIMKHPTVDGLQRILDIKSPTYFDRIRGVYVGLKNEGGDLSQQVVRFMEQRSREVANGIMATKISVKPKKGNDEINSEAIEALQQKLAEMEAKMQNMEPVVPKQEDADATQVDDKPKKTSTATAKKKTTSASAKKTTSSKNK